MHSELPTISIITICYNSAKTIRKTLDSVAKQTYPKIEHIIIDGKSTDDTLKIVAEYPHISAVYSEKDEGIYDAMNKGIDKATGDYLWFLHSDDQIYANNTLELAFAKHNNEDFVYGKTMMVNEQGAERSLEVRKPHPIAEKLSWKTLLNGMVIGHQAMFVKRSISPKYNLDYSIVGDLDWGIKVLKNSQSVRDTGIFLCRFVEGGISTQHRRKALKQRFDILKQHFGLLPTIGQHILIVFNAIKRGSIR